MHLKWVPFTIINTPPPVLLGLFFFEEHSGREILTVKIQFNLHYMTSTTMFTADLGHFRAQLLITLHIVSEAKCQTIDGRSSQTCHDSSTSDVTKSISTYHIDMNFKSRRKRQFKHLDI